jgi:prepilin-type N-terminal cleavage/methylation domain-containing protein/prepilin-type processing-associated H-X9-DG protein
MWCPARCSSCRKAFTLVELLVVLGIIVVLLAILLPTIARARERAHAVKCASNMRQIYMGCVMYSDMLGKLPIPGESGFPGGFEPGSCAAYGGGGLDFVRGGLWDFLGSSRADRAALFTCPSDEGYYISPAGHGHTYSESFNGNRRNYSYAFNCEMRGPLEPFIDEAAKPPPPGIRMTDITRPDRKILLIEIEQIDRLDFDYMATNGPASAGTGQAQEQNTFTHRHFGKGNQCFADGHVEMMPPIASFLPWWSGSAAYEYLDLFHNPDR